MVEGRGWGVGRVGGEAEAGGWVDLVNVASEQSFGRTLRVFICHLLIVSYEH